MGHTISIRYLLVFFLLLSVHSAYGGEDGGEDAAAKSDSSSAGPETDPQLQLNKEALTSKGSSEELRIKAANLLLFSSKPKAREVLLNVLEDSKNTAARMAVCKALSRAGAEQKEVPDREDFISPLLEILRSESDLSRARPAAEATIIFGYDELCKPLGSMVTDSNLSTQTRLNAIYALKLQPDKRAVTKLIKLLKGENEQVVSAARKALEKMGLPVKENDRNVEELKEWLSKHEENEFLRSLVVRWEIDARDMENKLEHWKDEYLDVLDKYYSTLEEDTSKAELLSGCLKSPAKIKKLWALERIAEWRRSTNPKLPGDMGPVLTDLLSTPDREVRLKAAKLLSLMGQFDSAKKLLERLDAEKDEEVRLAIFVALRVAVSYSSLAGSSDKISPELRTKTLKWAENYLSEKEPAEVQEGAVTIKKILEQNEMSSAELEKYLNLLAQRYEQASADGADNNKVSLRASLLNNMAGLCATGSDCKTEAAKVFRDLFVSALDDQSDSVREAAVEGLININKRESLNRFRQSDLISDTSGAIRKDLINLAGEVGDTRDLSWLWEKAGSSAEKDLAWAAMLNIFERSEPSALASWIEKLNIGGSDTILSVEQQVSFLALAEKKLSGEDNSQALKVVWRNLAHLYRKKGKYQQLVEYLGKLRGSSDNPKEKNALLPKMLDAYLRWPNPEGASNLLENCMLAGDLDPNSPVLQTIENYLNEPPAGAEPNEVLWSIVNKIEPVEKRPLWQKRIRQWRKRLGKKGGNNEEKADS